MTSRRDDRPEIDSWFGDQSRGLPGYIAIGALVATVAVVVLSLYNVSESLPSAIATALAPPGRQAGLDSTIIWAPTASGEALAMALALLVALGPVAGLAAAVIDYRSRRRTIAAAIAQPWILRTAIFLQAGALGILALAWTIVVADIVNTGSETALKPTLAATLFLGAWALPCAIGLRSALRLLGEHLPERG